MSFSYLCPVCAKPIGQEIFDKTKGMCPKCNVPVTITEDPPHDPSHYCGACGVKNGVLVTYCSDAPDPNYPHRPAPCTNVDMAKACPITIQNQRAFAHRHRVTWEKRPEFVYSMRRIGGEEDFSALTEDQVRLRLEKPEFIIVKKTEAA